MLKRRLFSIYSGDLQLKTKKEANRSHQVLSKSNSCSTVEHCNSFQAEKNVHFVTTLLAIRKPFDNFLEFLKTRSGINNILG